MIVLFLIGFAIYLDFSLKRTNAFSDYAGRPAAGAGTNWLLVGSDSRQGLSASQEAQLSTGDADGGRTDTMMLMHIPSGSGKPTLVSLPRDSYVPIPGHGRNKLNAAFAFGGPQLLTRTVEEATGLRIDHYAEIGFEGFVGVVDAVGGVNICVDQPLKDPAAGLNLSPGCQDLNGTQALGYVRTRHLYARQDLDRIQHQREFLSALLSKATSVGVLANPFRLFPLATNSVDTLTVDNGDHIWNLAGLAFALGGNGSTTGTVPIGSTQTISGVGSVVLWDKTKSKQLFDDFRQDSTVPDGLLSK
ncbi:LCP family protein [Gandjariella thermophila]|uniref:LCP family protein n=1 Tax=Gandjariella thermophila TaxID=1931992 RepID=UPI001CEF6E66|nr:LCP family protein [Gandjariella thermophila]